MEQLTEQQAKMVIEYFAQQAAEDYPGHDATFAEIEKHLWMTRYQLSLAIERQVGEWWWDSLVNNMLVWQSFDRDPEGWMNERDYVDFGYFKHSEALKDQVSMSINNVYGNSGA